VRIRLILRAATIALWRSGIRFPLSHGEREIEVVGRRQLVDGGYLRSLRPLPNNPCELIELSLIA